MLGQDTLYVRGVPDREIAEMAVRQGRTILTRDRDLARRVPGTVLLTSTEIADQLRSVHAAAPDLDWGLHFERCTECNGPLGRLTPAQKAAGPRAGPDPAGETYRCALCGHLYWEGTHTESVRRRVAQWLAEAGP